jgi:Fe-S-cluster containining protein
MDVSLTDLIRPAVESSLFDIEMTEMLAHLDREIAAHKPKCINRGDCCQFGRYGHRLYVTPAELAYFIRRQDGRSRPATADACPYQIDGRCTTREHRPLGCRVFHCEHSDEPWQHELTEQYLARLARLGRRHGMEYRYVEWLAALEQVAADAPHTNALDAANPDAARQVESSPKSHGPSRQHPLPIIPLIR